MFGGGDKIHYQETVIITDVNTRSKCATDMIKTKLTLNVSETLRIHNIFYNSPLIIYDSSY